MAITDMSGADVATRHSWCKLKPLPKRHTTVLLDFFLDRKQADRVRQGFIPSVQEEKWFVFFEDDTLYQHRSWTGICIDQVHFIAEGEGLRATHAEVNRYSPHYSNKDDQEDIDRITNMVRQLADLPLGAKSTAVDPMVAALETATQPNYLGSPEVVERLLIPFFDALIDVWRCRVGNRSAKEAREEVERKRLQLWRIFSGDDPDYVTMPWHSVEQLGQAAIRSFELDKDYCEGESLGFILDESFCSVSLIVGDLLRKFVYAEEHHRDHDVAPQIHTLIKFTGAVLLGTNTVCYPAETIMTVLSRVSPPSNRTDLHQPAAQRITSWDGAVKKTTQTD